MAMTWADTVNRLQRGGTTGTREDRDVWDHPWENPLEIKEKNKMTTSFTIDMNSNTLSFGTVANGQVTNISGNIALSSEMGVQPFGGLIKGDFVGEIKGDTSPPITIPHKKSNPAGFNIMVVGAGGTGGYLIRDLAKFIFALKEKGDSRQFSLSIIDGDVVETKNVLRQNFIGKDVGKLKADVQAKRYANAFGIEIQSVTEMADKKLLTSLHSRVNLNNHAVQNIVVGCVDNHKARRAIQQYMKSHSRTYWIDSGNETKSGQVVLGYDNFSNSNQTGYGSNTGYAAPDRNSQYQLPNVIDLYPEIADESQDEVVEEKVSCAERAVVDTQNIFVNQYAAGHVLSFLRQVIMEEPITINCIEYNIKGLTSVKHLTGPYLDSVYQNIRK